MAPTIEHWPERSRFLTTVDGRLGIADYRLADGVMHMTHTEVDPALEGRGVAATLLEAAFAHARANGLRVNPLCSYVRVYMQRHPQTQDLLA